MLLIAIVPLHQLRPLASIVFALLQESSSPVSLWSAKSVCPFLCQTTTKWTHRERTARTVLSTERDGSGFTPEDLSFVDFSASLCTSELRQNGAPFTPPYNYLCSGFSSVATIFSSTNFAYFNGRIRASIF